MREEEILTFVKPLYADRDSMHDLNHILSLRKRVDLLKTVVGGVNEGKLTFLIYFHGLITYVRAHEQEIVDLGFPADWIAALYKHLVSPQSLEEKLVSDANSLEAVGEFGIQRSLNTGKERGQSFEETVRIMRANLSRVVFHTEIGRELGEQGIRVVEKFLEQYKSEDD
jgi:hypothetical protein